MTSFFTHMAIGIAFAELILRSRMSDTERAQSRVKYWWVGLFAGLLPDLDVIPGVILGLHPYTFHHIATHTFFAIGIVALFAFVIYRDNSLSLPFFASFSMAIFVDFIDNSISPLGPFDPLTEWGLLCGWGPIPGGSWSSEYWLPPLGPILYGNHDLWLVFMNKGWDIPIGFEFLSYYDLVGIGFFAIFFVYLMIETVKPYIS